MEVIHTDIPGVEIIRPRIFRDSRGYFFESYSREDFNRLVSPVDFVQDNQSRSTYGVVRGLHFQKGKDAQSKLVRVVEGRVLFTAADKEDGVILKKGMFAVLEDGATAPELHSGHLNPAAWATGMFSYDDARLRDALDELEGYYNVSLTVSPASASTQTFSGKFSTGSLDDIIYALESALGVKISRQ